MGLLSLTFILGLNSCGTTEIVGKWQLSDMDLVMEIPQGQEDLFESLMQEMRDNTFYIFEEDGTMEAQLYVVNDTEEHKGTYELKKDQLEMTIDDKTEIVGYNLQDSTLTIFMEENGTKMSMTFTKK